MFTKRGWNMKSIIRELWQDKINPSVDVNTITPEIKELYAKIDKAEEKITANFTKERKQNSKNTQTIL